LIGNGTPEQGRDFLHEMQVENLPFQLILDPQLVGYRTAQLERSLLYGVRPRTILSLIRAWRSGLRAGPMEGDAHEMGGAFVICPERGVVYSFVCRVLGEQPDLEVIVAALDRLRREADDRVVTA
jgi:hypothetical protein